MRWEEREERDCGSEEGCSRKGVEAVSGSHVGEMSMVLPQHERVRESEREREIGRVKQRKKEGKKRGRGGTDVAYSVRVGKERRKRLTKGGDEGGQNNGKRKDGVNQLKKIRPRTVSQAVSTVMQTNLSSVLAFEADIFLHRRQKLPQRSSEMDPSENMLACVALLRPTTVINWHFTLVS